MGTTSAHSGKRWGSCHVSAAGLNGTCSPIIIIPADSVRCPLLLVALLFVAAVIALNRRLLSCTRMYFLLVPWWGRSGWSCCRIWKGCGLVRHVRKARERVLLSPGRRLTPRRHGQGKGRPPTPLHTDPPPTPPPSSCCCKKNLIYKYVFTFSNTYAAARWPLASSPLNIT